MQEQQQRTIRELEGKVAALEKELSDARAAMAISQEFAATANRRLADTEEALRRAAAEAEAERARLEGEVEAAQAASVAAQSKAEQLARELRDARAAQPAAGATPQATAASAAPRPPPEAQMWLETHLAEAVEVLKQAAESAAQVEAERARLAVELAAAQAAQALAEEKAAALTHELVDGLLAQRRSAAAAATSAASSSPPAPPPPPSGGAAASAPDGAPAAAAAAAEEEDRRPPAAAAPQAPAPAAPAAVAAPPAAGAPPAGPARAADAPRAPAPPPPPPPSAGTRPAAPLPAEEAAQPPAATVEPDGFARTRDAIEAAAGVAAEEQRHSPVASMPSERPAVPAGGAAPPAAGAVAELVRPPGYYWTLPAQRYEFGEGREVQVGSAHFVEQRGEVAKPGQAKARVCEFSRLASAVPKEAASKILAHVVRSKSYVTTPDSVDHTPTFEYYPFQDGKWLDLELQPLLEPLMEGCILPYIRQRYSSPECAMADILVRRYLPGERRTHAVHFDGHAFVTAVLGLSDPDGYDGGLYLQPGPDVSSRLFFRLEPGDLLVHSFDLQHGVHVWQGTRYSLIFWIKDSAASVKQHTTPWYDRLADTGDCDALYALAMHHANGSSGKPLDIVKAIELYERSAQGGHYFAQNNLGTLYKRAHSVMGLPSGLEKSARWLLRAAEAGFAMAQKNLSLAFSAGEGLPKSDAKAAEWMTRAAEQLDVEAAYLVADMHRSGRGVRADLREAALWYQRSAEAGFPQAQYTLGLLHMEGRGVPKDEKKAEHWFRCAAQQGVKEAQNNIAALHAQRGQIDQAAEIWAELAEAGEANAQCNLGMCYMRGLGREKDNVKAKEWLQKAAAKGHQMAIHALMQV